MIWVVCDKREPGKFSFEEIKKVAEFTKDCDCDKCTSHRKQDESYKEFVEARERNLLYGWYEPLKD